jgi:hypothetical protein
MARAGLGMAALMGCVSHFAIGTAHAFEISAPDDAQVADVFWAVVIGVVAYGVFQGLRRCFRGAGSAFWTSTFGRWLIGRMAGTAVLGCLLGTGFFVSNRAIVLVVETLIRLRVPLSNDLFLGIMLSMWAGAIVAAWRLRTSVKVCIGKGSRPLRRLVRTLGMGGGGSAGFAGICEEWANRWQPGEIFLGHSLFDRHWPVGIKDDRMLCTMAGTGGGKSESALIGNLLLHPGSVFAVDVKGQLAAVTAEARRKNGQTVHVIDPLNVLGQGTARIEPLSDLDPEALDYVERLRKIVDAMVLSTGEKNRFFDEGARTVIAGGMDFLKRRKTGEFVPPEEEREEEETNGE